MCPARFSIAKPVRTAVVSGSVAPPPRPPIGADHARRGRGRRLSATDGTQQGVSADRQHRPLGQSGTGPTAEGEAVEAGDTWKRPPGGRGSAPSIRRLRVGLRRLFYGRRPAAVRFQIGLLALDFAVVAYFLATTFVRDASWLRAASLLFGLPLAGEFLARMLAHRHPAESGAVWRYLDKGAAMVDLSVAASLLVPALGANLGFLRLLRTARVLRSHNVLGRLKALSPAIARSEEVIRAALDLTVFVLIASSLVYVTQHGTNEKIADFVGALYFTVATLSTTGFGDITLLGSTSGELLSVAMMIVGISLFFRLAQAAFRPGGKVRHPCPRCGLIRHDADAAHCKACGHVLDIPDDRV